MDDNIVLNLYQQLPIGCILFIEYGTMCYIDYNTGNIV